jgi:hypothetical protein
MRLGGSERLELARCFTCCPSRSCRCCSGYIVGVDARVGAEGRRGGVVAEGKSAMREQRVMHITGLGEELRVGGEGEGGGGGVTVRLRGEEPIDRRQWFVQRA